MSEIQRIQAQLARTRAGSPLRARLVAKLLLLENAGGMAFCPFCGQRDTIEADGSHFAEAGEWDDKDYEYEGFVDEYRCTACSGKWAAALKSTLGF